MKPRVKTKQPISTMNAGTKTIDWLYSEQLRVDAEWSIKTANGFVWWADSNAQTVEVIGEETDEKCGTAWLVSVRTDFLRNVEATDSTLEKLSLMLAPVASMVGPVFDEDTGTVALCSLVRVHEGNREWMAPLISVAAALQIGEARIAGPGIAKILGAEPAESGHPENGRRPEPDEIAELIANLIEPLGRESSSWSALEFVNMDKNYLQGPPAVLATCGAKGFTAEFPFGKSTSLLQVMNDQPHPRYGNGLFVLQSFKLRKLSTAEGTRLALALNAEELTRCPLGYGYGSYCFRDEALNFVTFIPNVAHNSVLLPNLYLACASRSSALDQRLAPFLPS